MKKSKQVSSQPTVVNATQANQQAKTLNKDVTETSDFVAPRVGGPTIRLQNGTEIKTVLDPNRRLAKNGDSKNK